MVTRINTLVSGDHSGYLGSLLATQFFSLYWVHDLGRGRKNQLSPMNLHLGSQHHKLPAHLDWNRRTVFFRLSCQILYWRLSFCVILSLSPFARPHGRSTTRRRAFGWITFKWGGGGEGKEEKLHRVTSTFNISWYHIQSSLFQVYQIISAFYLIDLNKTQSQEYTNKFAESIEYKR